MAFGGSPTWNDDEEEKYPFSPQKGKAIIIINDGQQREGSQEDKIMLLQMFPQLGFTPEVISDLCGKELLEELRRISGQDFSGTDCLAIAISSHGDEGLTGQKITEDYIRVRDGKIWTKVIVNMFTDEKCPSLKGKPRLFFIQACRGRRIDHGQEVVVGSTAVRSNDDPTVNIHNRTMNPPQQTSGAGDSGNESQDIVVRAAPCYADFLIMYATPPGHFAFRNPDHGSAFIKCLCEVLLKTDGPLSIMNRLTRVVAAIAKRDSNLPSSPEYHGKKQTPVINSMLTKDLCLLPSGSQSS